MIYLDDKTIDKLIATAFDPLVEWQHTGRETRPLGAVSKALGLITEEECRAAAKVKSHDTVKGNQLQKFVALIAKQNKEVFEVFDNPRPNGHVTDTALIANDQTYLMFVQATSHTKNGDGNKAIKIKMKEKRGSKGIVAIFEGEPLRKECKGNIIKFQGMELFRFLTSTDPEFTDGDSTLYDRIIQGFERFGKKIR